MDAAQYYVTTLTNSVKTIGPIVLFLLGGYLIFIKMPFLFLKKSMDDQKKNLKEAPSSPEIEHKNERPKDQKIEDKKQEKKQEKKEERKAPPKRPVRPTGLNPHVVLGFKTGESVSAQELKKRYFDLLKQNHPDRVAAMGEDFQKLAEKNTKEINWAYEELKKKAA